MTERDQQLEDSYTVAVVSPRCIAGEHGHCTGYCECGCH